MITRLALRFVFVSGVALLAFAGSAAAATISGQVKERPAIAAATSGPGTAVAHSTSGDAASTWTPADLRNARPADVAAPPLTQTGMPEFSLPAPTARTSDTEIVDPSKAPYRLHGKVFFRVGADTFTCSATVVDSKNRNVIFTAGHCVFDSGTKTWVQDLVFIPGYRDGQAPFGIYKGGEMVTTNGWIKFADFRYDVATVALAGKVQNKVGARKVHFAADPRKRNFTIFGYPSMPEALYDGERLIRCDSGFAGFDTTNSEPQMVGASPCDMMQGSSGGGWIINGNYLASVVSYGYCDSIPNLCGVILGPQLLSGAISVYGFEKIGGSAKPTVRVMKAPPRKVRKRKVVFRLKGNGSTPMHFKVRLDRQGWVTTTAKVTVRKLSLGKHTLRIRSEDQTGHLSPKTIKRVFKVLPKKKPKKKR